MTMKKQSLFTALTAISLISISAHAEESHKKYYIRSSLSAQFQQDTDLSSSLGNIPADFDNAALFAIEAGYQVTDNVRAGLQLSYSELDATGDVSGTTLLQSRAETEALSVMVNGYYDFKNETKFTPYVGGGLGVSFIEASTYSEDSSFIYTSEGDDEVLAYNLMAGLNYAATDNITVGAEYKYFGTEEVNLDGVKADNESHNVGVTLAYHF